MAEIYTAPRDEKAFLSLIEKKLNKKDYLSALLITDSVLTLPKFDKLNVYALRAKIYYYMKQYARSSEEWFKYLSSTQNEKLYGRAYNGLGACFYKMQDKNVAGYYFNRQIINNKKAIYEFSSVTAEFYEDVLSADKNYYLAYPYEKADFTNLLLKAEDALRVNEYDKCVEMLSVIPETSKDYPTALITKSIAKYFLGDIEGATLDIEKSISLEKKAVAVCNAISMFHSTQNEEKVDYYLNLLSKMSVESEEDLYKVAVVYAEKGMHQTAITFAEKYLKLCPYDTSMLLVYGIMNYNLKRFDKAEETFEKVYKINRSYVAKSYIKFCKEDRDENFLELEYSFDLHVGDRHALIKKISSLMKLSTQDKLSLENEIYELSNYAFSTSSYQIQSTIITLLGELATDTATQIMKKMLLSLNVYDRVKSGIIGYLVASNTSGETPCTFGNIFRKTIIHSAEFESERFTEAYAYVVAKLAPLEKDLLPLKTSAEALYLKAIDKGVLDDIVDVKALSAVIYELSSISNIKSRREFAKFFDASPRQIKAIKELLQN